MAELDELLTEQRTRLVTFASGSDTERTAAEDTADLLMVSGKHGATDEERRRHVERERERDRLRRLGVKLRD